MSYRCIIVLLVLLQAGLSSPAQVPARHVGEDSATYMNRALKVMRDHNDRQVARGDSAYTVMDLAFAKRAYLYSKLGAVSDLEHCEQRLRDIERQERFGLDNHTVATYPHPAHPGCQEFHLAIMRGDSLSVLRSIARDPSLIRAVDNRGNTPLHTAADSNAVALIKILLNAGADALATDTAGQAPLHRARSPAAVKLLMANGADVNARDHKGATPLLAYADRGEPSIELQNTLIANGSDVNARMFDGSTVLIKAAAAGDYSLDAIDALLKAGAYLHDVDAQGRNALWWAERFWREDLSDFLIGKGAKKP